MNRQIFSLTRNIRAHVLAVAALACSHATLVAGQAVSDTTANSLAAREEELKRKENELLRSMGMAPDSSLNQNQKKIEVPHSGGNAQINPSQIDSATDFPTAVVQAAQAPASNDQALETLKAIENHPALQSKKKSVPSSTGTSGTITTHRSLHSKNEGTAHRLDTFRRVDGTRSNLTDNDQTMSRSRLVSLREIELETARRPAPLADPSIATIGVTPAKLRSGPSSTHSSLGSLSKYSEVTIDYRSGDWYRVKTSGGQRGWVKGQTLMFDAGIPLTSTLKIGAVRAEPGSKVPR